MNFQIAFSLALIVLVSCNASTQTEKTVTIPDEQIGIIINNDTDEFIQDSLMRPGKHTLNNNFEILILDLAERKFNGSLPRELKNKTKVIFEFQCEYKLREIDYSKFVKIFGDDENWYEGAYLVPKIEEQIFIQTKGMNLKELSPAIIQEIAGRIQNAFNSNPEPSRYFKLLSVNLSYKLI